MIYLDNSATTKPLPEVLESFMKSAESFYANPSSVHQLGSDAERLLTKSRTLVADLMELEASEVLFTSGGTEANNLAIKGIALKHQNRGKHLITTTIEHPSVLEAFHSLESLGFEVTYVNVDEAGHVDPDEIDKAIRKDTILVSVMSVNNEIGTVQPIEEIGRLTNKYPKLFFHVDHVQGLGKVPIHIKDWSIDLVSISGHKIHGLKGTGALFVRKNVSLFPLLHGGRQEQEKRAGTENLPGIVALAKAIRLIKQKEKDHLQELKALQGDLKQQLRQIDGLVINSPENGAPHIVNISLPGFKPEVLIHKLAENEIYISTKSACSSKQSDVSAVLEACKLEAERSTSSLRISLSYQNTKAEIDQFVQALKSAVVHVTHQ
ncbi:cysteine desulfurase family protein [Halobacillus naozhouensis]|uniref:Cysteine desulfurase family protein n=1 Tax=Halobacillus naozhouensis TaxID=554880 RepID=A0ABY8IW02_9BACI|nr:cysteine desulfurase family protein [Halobacillus naozhouensis]WFT73504.1 cysteine desulfurase family protein [Halobacillus naozhouensis]